MKIAICDDNQEYACYLKEQIRNYFQSSSTDSPRLTAYHSGHLAAHLEQHGCDYDILLLKISSGKSDIINIAHTINQLNPKALIIYIGDCMEVTEQIYETYHIYFISKANIATFLPKALSKAERILFERYRYAFLSLKGEGVVYQLPTNSIKYFEVSGHKICVYTTRKNYQTSCPLSSLARMLPANFARTHNSFILNFEYIHAVYSDYVQLVDENIIPVSRTYKKAFRNAYNAYLSILT